MKQGLAFKAVLQGHFSGIASYKLKGVVSLAGRDPKIISFSLLADPQLTFFTKDVTFYTSY